MIRKASYFLLAFLVFAAATFAVAPMAFCKMKPVAEATSDCCKKPVKPTNHCTPTGEACPICANNLCNAGPIDAKNTAQKEFSRVERVTMLAFSFSPIAVVAQSGIVTIEYSYIHNGPPLYLEHSILRL